jgi:hypothetical protein
VSPSSSAFVAVTNPLIAAGSLVSFNDRSLWIQLSTLRELRPYS